MRVGSTTAFWGHLSSSCRPGSIWAHCSIGLACHRIGYLCLVGRLGGLVGGCGAPANSPWQVQETVIVPIMY
jgi:hypothetical protein